MSQRVWRCWFVRLKADELSSFDGELSGLNIIYMYAYIILQIQPVFNRFFVFYIFFLRKADIKL